MSDKLMVTYCFNAYYAWFLEVTGQVYITVKTNNITNPVAIQGKTEDDTITYNVAPSAVEQLAVNDINISFYCRFNGLQTFVEIPMADVLLMFSPKLQHMPLISIQHIYETSIKIKKTNYPDSDTINPPPSPPVKAKPKLTLVK